MAQMLGVLLIIGFILMVLVYGFWNMAALIGLVLVAVIAERAMAE